MHLAQPVWCGDGGTAHWKYNHTLPRGSWLFPFFLSPFYFKYLCQQVVVGGNKTRNCCWQQK